MKSVSYASHNISSIPIINKVSHSSSRLLNTVWITILVVGLFQSVLRINRFLHLYFQYPVKVSLEIEEEQHLSFPDVTFCNLNRMNEIFQHCHAEGKRMQFCESTDNLEVEFVISERKHYSPEKKYCSSLHNEQPLDDLSEMNDFLKRFSSEPEENRKRLGYQSYELIRECIFDGTVCSSENFSQLQSLQYGNCYTFNNIGSRKSLNTHEFGAASGLQVVLNIDPDNYLYISQSLGAKVFIRNPEENPDLDKTGVTISPGFETSIALSQTVYERLPSPYRDHCVNYQTAERTGQKSEMECIKICVQNINYATCGCLDPTMLKIDDLPLCNISNITESCCLNDVLREISSKENARDCPLACSKVSYNEQISMSIWPSKKLIPTLKIFTDEEFRWSRKNKLRFVRKGFAKVKVFYSTFKKSTYSQKPMYQNHELYSYLGGELGLWLGLSVATVFEMLELFLKFCKCILLKMTSQVVIL